MKLTKNNKISLAFWGSLLGGVFVLSLTQPPNLEAKQARSFSGGIESQSDLISSAGYLNQIRPWLKSVIEDYSLQTVQAVKNKLLALQSPDQSLGQAHINLFLAFQDWESFLNSDQKIFKEQTKTRLTTVAGLLPALSAELDNLQNILN